MGRRFFIAISILLVVFFVFVAIVGCDTADLNCDHAKVTYVASVDPTCTENGNTEYWYCPECKKCFSDEAATQEIKQTDTVVPATGHQWGEWESGDSESHYHVCDICGEREGGQHDYVDGSCIICGAEKETLPVHIHELSYMAPQSVTCTEDGNIGCWYCKKCDKYFVDEQAEQEIIEDDVFIVATGHAWGTPVLQWGSDYSSLNVTLTCDNDETHVWSASVSGDEISVETVRETSCEIPGAIKYSVTLKVDGKEQTFTAKVNVPATGHTNLTQHDRVESTCISEGNIEYWSCDECGKCFEDENADNEIAEEEVVLSKLDHALTHFERVEATCISEGNIEYWQCDNCQKYFADENATKEISESDTVIAMSAHEVDAWQFDDESHWHVCEICDKKLDVAAHEYDEDGLCSTCGFNISGTQGLEYDLINDEYEVVGIGSALNETNIVIPSVYNGKAVTSIGYEAFADCANIETLTVPSSVQTIGSRAFKGCSGLTELKIPFVGASVATSGASASTLFGYVFGNIEYDGSVETEQSYNGVDNVVYYIPGSLTSVTVSGGNLLRGAFMNCTGINYVRLGDEMSEIGEYAFAGCNGLRSVEIGQESALGIIGGFAFANTSIEEIFIPERVTEIGERAFKDCLSLNAIAVDGGNGYYMSVNGVLYSKDRSTFISYPAAKKDETYEVRNGVLTIEEYAFDGAKYLTEVIVPDSVTVISRSAFNNCNALEKIDLPYIGGSANESNAYFAYIFGAENYSDSGIKVPASLKKVIIRSGNIGDNAFSHCSNIVEIVVPDNLTSIGASSFSGCFSLAEINIPSGVEDIGSHAFSGCSSLGELTIPSAIKNIGEYTFYGCSSLTTVNMPDGITAIGEYAFADCTLLANLKMPSELRSIGASAFSGCSSLEYLTLPEGIETIEKSAFSDCTALKNINIPKGINTLPDFLFKGCTSLTSLVIPDEITSIGESVLSGCSSLESLTVPFVGNSEDNTKASRLTLFGYLFGDDAYDGGVKTAQFYDSTNKYNYYIPASLKSVVVKRGNIWYGAFSNCVNLTDVIIEDGVTAMGSSTFNGCSSLESLTIPFVGAKLGVTSSSTYQYPLGYIFGTVSYNGGAEVRQSYYASSTSITATFSYYLPLSLKNVTVNGGSILLGAFSECFMLESIIIPDNTYRIGSNAFSGCTNLKSIFIPGSVAYIERLAFRDCSSLENVYIEDLAKWCQINFNETASNPLANKANLYVNGELLTELIIPEEVSSISPYAFAGCVSITSVIIPDSVTEIGNEAFDSCISLESITLPFTGRSKNATVSSASTLFGYIFGTGADDGLIYVNQKYADGSKNYYIPELLTTVRFTGSKIMYGAFSGCNMLTDLYLDNTLTTIDKNAFYGCNSIKSVHVSDMETWLNISFADEYSNPLSQNQQAELWRNGEILTEIVVPDGTTSLSQYVFYNYANMISIVLPESVQFIGKYALANCSLIESIELPGQISIINDYAFSGCSSLVNVSIPGKVTTIKPYTFENCTSLTEITIPESVTSIGEYAFSGCSSLVNISIPEKVTTINAYAFENCTSLTEIIIPESVTSIAEAVFRGCSALISITLPFIGTGSELYDYPFGVIFGGDAYDGGVGITQRVGGSAFLYYLPASLKEVTITKGEVVQGAFSGCSMIEKIVLPENLTEIAEETFAGCSSLRSIVIPDNVAIIGDYAFSNCTLLEKVTISKSLTSFGMGVFTECTALESINISDLAAWCNVTFDSYVSMDLFDLYCNGELVTELVIPDSVENINDYAFANVASIKKLILHQNVTSIGLEAFSNCEIKEADVSMYAFDFIPTKYLNKLTVNSGDSISSDNIRNCSELQSITIADTIKSIHSSFSDITTLKEVYITDLKAWCEIDFWDEDANPLTGGAKLYLNDAFVTELNVTEDIGIINDYAFAGYSYLTKVNLLGDIDSIGYFAFRDCVSLTEIRANGNVTSVNNQAFYNCGNIEIATAAAGLLAKISKANLREVTINGSEGVYANTGFGNCGELVRVTIEDQVPEIGDDAFINCTALSELNISDSVTSIGNNAFEDCASLKEIIMSGSITAINEYTFSGCTSLTDICFPQNLTTIGNYAFAGCASLTEISLPQSVTTIGNHAFAGCATLTEISLPQSVTTIGNYAFSDCTSLTEVYIPESIESIDSYVFDNCENIEIATATAGVLSNISKTNLREVTITGSGSVNNSLKNSEKIVKVTIGDKITGIGSEAFRNCTSLTDIIIPDSVTTIGQWAFGNCESLKYIIIPESVETIEGYAFDSSTVIYCEAESRPSGWSVAWNTYGNNYVSWGCKNLVMADGLIYIVRGNEAEVSVQYKGIVNAEILPEIEYDGAFYNVTKIASNAFYLCELESVSIPASITDIGSNAFNMCYSLDAVYITDLRLWISIVFGSGRANPLSDGAQLYLNGEPVNELTIPEGVTKIGDYAFYMCGGIVSITLPDSLTEIGTSAFSGCDLVSEVTIPVNTVVINNYAFTGCDGLTIYCEAASKPEGWSSNWKDADTPVVWDCNNTGIAEDGYRYVVIDGLRYALKDGMAIVTRQLRNLSGNIEIPVSVTYNDNVYTVIEISDRAFEDCPGLESVSIPAGVTSIGEYAFAYCGLLTTVTFAENSVLGSIGDYAFDSCTSLTGIDIPSSVESMGYYVFNKCSALESITLPFVGLNADATVASASTLFGIIFSTSEFEGSIKIEQYYSESNYKSYYIPQYLSEVTVQRGNILFGAFSGCNSIAYVTICKDVENVGSKIFMNSTATIIRCEALSCPSNWDSYWNINNNPVVWDCMNNNKAEDGYEYVLSDGLIYGLSNGSAIVGKQRSDLTGKVDISGSIVIEDVEYPVVKIGDSAFANCPDITGISIPASVSSVGRDLFAVGARISSIYIEDVAQWLNYASDLQSNMSRNLYLNGEIVTTLVIPEGITQIKNRSFIYFASITEVVFPSTLKTIGDWAFAYTGLSQLILPEGVTNIGANAFYEASKLSKVSIASSVTKVGEAAFAHCFVLNDVEIKANLTEIGRYVFGDCHLLREIVLPDSLQIIGEIAFVNCALQSIVIPAGVSQISARAFDGCDNMTSATFENIEGWAYYASQSSSEGTSISSSLIDDSSQVAVYLSSTYSQYCWKRV